MNKVKQKNYEIEFLRFVFASMIVLKHSKNLFPDGGKLFLKGSFSVEFFFIVSGYFMMNSICRKNANGPAARLGDETFHYLWKKISSIYVELIVAYILGIIFIICTATAPYKTVIKEIVLSIPSDVFLLSTGIGGHSINGPLWYLSSMLLSMLVLYPLIRKWPDNSVYIAIPLISIISLGYLWNNYHSLLTPMTWMGFTFKGNLRALAELGIGVILWKTNQVFSSLQFKTWFRFFLTAIKWCGYIGLLIWMIFFSSAGVQILCLGVFAVSILLSLSGQCCDQRLFNGKICVFLGKLSMPMYLSHFYLSSSQIRISSISNVLPDTLSYGATLLIYYIFALALSIAVWFISKTIRARDLGKVFRTALIKE